MFLFQATLLSIGITRTDLGLAVRNLLNKIICNEFAAKLNWAGQGGKTGVKFSNLQKLIKGNSTIYRFA